MKKKAIDKNREKTLTLSNFVVHWLKDLDSRIKTTGFREELFQLFNSDKLFSSKERKEMWTTGRCRFIPDAYFFDYKHRIVFIFEVEDTHTLSYPKIADLSDAWWLLDEIRWDFRIFLVDRYCGNWRTIPIGNTQFIYMTTVEGTGKKLDQKRSIDWQQTYRRAAINSWLFPGEELSKEDEEENLHFLLSGLPPTKQRQKK